MAKKKKIDTEVVDSPATDDAKRAKALEVAIKGLKNRFGDASIAPLTQASVGYDIISTGSFSLDSALGVGGFARGRLYELFGMPASGKSTLAFSVIREATKKGIHCLYLDVERALDKQLLSKMGIDTDYVMLVHAFTGEEYLDIAETLLSTGAFGVCILDSITSLLPTAEADQDSFGDQSMGLLGRLTSKMCRKIIPLAGRTNTLLMVINQLRDTIGSYGHGPTTTGGKSIPFYATGRIKVAGGSAKASRIENSDGLVIGHRVEFEVVKNKLAAPFRSAEVDLIYGEGYDTYGEILDLSVDMGLIDKAGAWYSYNGAQLGQGRDKTLLNLKKDQELCDKLRVEIAKILNLPGLSE